MCIFPKSVEKIQGSLKFEKKKTSTFYKDLRSSMTAPCSILLKWEMFQTKVVEKIKTQILCSNFFFPKYNAKNVVKPDRPQIIQYGAFVLHVG
jgi:hypothetical protein